MNKTEKMENEKKQKIEELANELCRLNIAVKMAKTDEDKKLAHENFMNHRNAMKPLVGEDDEAIAMIKMIMEKCD